MVLNIVGAISLWSGLMDYSILNAKQVFCVDTGCLIDVEDDAMWNFVKKQLTPLWFWL